MTILKKLIVIVAVAAVPFIIVLTLSALLFARFSIGQSISGDQLQLARQAMSTIDRSLYEKQRQILLIADDLGLQESLSGVRTGRPANDPVKRLKDFGSSTGPWDTLRVLTPAGGMLYSTADNEQNTKLPAGSEYRRVFDVAAKGGTAYSEAFIDADSQRPTMLFAAAVRDESKAASPVIGVVVGSLTWSGVIDALATTPGRTIELFNGQGLLLASSNPGSSEQVLIAAEHTNPAVRKALTGAEGTETVRSLSGNEEHLVSYVRQQGYKDFKSTQWILVINTPTAVAFATADQIATVLPPIFLFITLLAMSAILWLLNRSVVAPMHALTAVAKEIAAGDLSHRAAVSSKDEYGQLGTAFNRMTDKLQELYRDLEAKVNDKTNLLGLKVQEVEREKAKDDAIISSIGEGLIVTDAELKVDVINKIAAETLDIDAAAAHGKPLSEVVHLEYEDYTVVPPEGLPAAVALKTARKALADLRYTGSDGKPRALAVIATPMIQGGKTTGVVMVTRDITKEKEVDRMKTEFISLASHQLRTPLSAIKWFSEMLLSGDAGKQNEEQQGFTKNIYDSTERMIELVNSLLNISRIESGRIIVDPVPTNLEKLVGGIINDLVEQTEQRQQRLVVSAHKDLPIINLDPKLIGQVYLNLLTNAIKYTPKGGEITIFISRKDDEVISQVTDSGYGIPKAAQSKLFHKFFRADNAVKIDTDGSGLGLYLVKSIVESSGGRIWFESEENKGTTFWFTIPLDGMKPKAGEVTLDPMVGM